MQEFFDYLHTDPRSTDPGFTNIPNASDLPAFFNRRYKTYVKDKTSGAILKSIEWSVYISLSKGAGGLPVEKYWFSL